jgi:hypothetical protein
MVSNSRYQNLFFVFVPLPVSHAFEYVSVVIRVVVVLLMLLTVFDGIRERGDRLQPLFSKFYIGAALAGS